MAGYSGTPLPKKLGIKPGHRVALIQAPKGFALGELPEGATTSARLNGGPFNVLLLFAKDSAAMEKYFDSARAVMTIDGGLWVCWPKKASGVETDLTETEVRESGLETGLVDNKVCAVDDTWSGLRFVVRVKDRPKAKK
ncbi:MAG: DUF3052 domain-containing protein [Planctomycetota bacterium]